jgi:hypothetical protein
MCNSFSTHEAAMKFWKTEHQHLSHDGESPSPLVSLVEVEQKGLRAVAEKICESNECRYPLLALRLLIHVITGIDSNGKIHLSARQLSKSMGVHYDTITKCLKYLREIGVLRIDN